jgi:HAMP domain-containing protein
MSVLWLKSHGSANDDVAKSWFSVTVFGLTVTSVTSAPAGRFGRVATRVARMAATATMPMRRGSGEIELMSGDIGARSAEV